MPRIIIFTLIDCDQTVGHSSPQTLCLRACRVQTTIERNNSSPPETLFPRDFAKIHFMRIHVRVSRPQDDVRVRVSKRHDPRSEVADGRVGETRRFRIDLPGSCQEDFAESLSAFCGCTRGACWSKNAADPSPRALLGAIVAKNEGISSSVFREKFHIIFLPFFLSRIFSLESAFEVFRSIW